MLAHIAEKAHSEGAPIPLEKTRPFFQTYLLASIPSTIRSTRRGSGVSFNEPVHVS